MKSHNRAAWAKPFAFSKRQQKSLSNILKRHSKDKIKSFLTDVELAVIFLKMDWEGKLSSSSETPAEARENLRKIERHAETLHKVLQETKFAGSETALITAMSRLGRGHETIEYLNSDLPLVYICAKVAAGYLDKGKRGRPSDTIEQDFIGKLGQLYLEHFSKRPAFSRATVFSMFVTAVFEIALPENPHTGFDNSKIIKAALTRCGIISSRKKPA